MEFAFQGENFCVRIVSREVRSTAQEFEVVVRPAVALCVPFTKDGLIVLVRQYRAAVNGITLEFPAGSVRTGEDPEHAARNELLEESGFLVSTIDRLGTLLTAPHFSDELVTVFAADGEITSSPMPTPKEELQEVVEMPPKAVRTLIQDGHLVDCKSVAAYMLACGRGTLFGVKL